jgi:hypothetical protein
MAKRARKPRKKQAQPWTAAARAKNRGKGGPMSEQDQADAIAGAVLEMAGPEVAGLPPDATEEQLNTVLGFTTMVYNQPLFEANPQVRVKGETLAAVLRKMLESIFETVPNAKAAFDRMTVHRTLRFAHLKRPILSLEASWDEERTLIVNLSLGAEDLHDVVSGDDDDDDATPPEEPPSST